MTLKQTCLEEVSLRMTLRVIAFLWSEEETYSTHLTHTLHTVTQLCAVFTEQCRSWISFI